MLSLLKCKFLIGYLWTSGITAGLLTIVFFSFIDPMSVARMMELQQGSALFEVKIYASIFTFIWFILNTSTYLNHYFSQLLKSLEEEEQRKAREGKALDETTGLEAG